MTGKTGYSLEGNGTDLSKLYPSGGTNMGFSAITTTYVPNVNYMQVIPNSHYWGNLDQLLTYLGYIQDSGNPFYTNAWNEEVKQIIIGLENTIKNGYKLKKVSGIVNLNSYYNSIEEMISDIKEVNISPDYPANEFLKDFIMKIENTVDMGYNLTNGLKMERKEVYKRLDGERDYQDDKWGTRRTLEGTPDEEKPVAEWINYMEFHLAKAKEKVYYLKTEEALAEIRKVTALGVRAMEIHGCPERGGTPVNGEKPCTDDNCDCKGVK